MAATFEPAGGGGGGGWLVGGGGGTRVAEGGRRGAVEGGGEAGSEGTVVVGVGLGVRREGLPVVEVESVVESVVATATEVTDGTIGVGMVRGGEATAEDGIK